MPINVLPTATVPGVPAPPAKHLCNPPSVSVALFPVGVKKPELRPIGNLKPSGLVLCN